MIEATVLVPTYRHARFLPYAIRSTLAQRDVPFELLVVGDGVEDDTREAVAPFLADPRLRFLDLPKGERHGEGNRHDALLEARGRIVCYLSDDDVLLPGHLAEMRRLLEDADFAHSAPVRALPGGILEHVPGDLGRPEFLDLIRRGENNFVGLTGAAHTREAYDRLDGGWRPAPPGTATDIHMWRRLAALPGFRGATGRRLTAVHLPDPAWRAADPDLRAAELERWLADAARPDAEERFERLLQEAIRTSAQDFKLRAVALRRALEACEREVERLRRPRVLRAASRVARAVVRSRHR